MTDSPSQAVKVRGRNAEDWRAIAAICRAQPPERNPLDIPYASDDQAQAELGKADSGKFGLIAELDNLVIGAIALHSGHGRTRHLGYMDGFVVDPAYQGKGVGSVLLGALIDLAENWLNLTRLQNMIAVDNAPALTLHRKHGFIIEGKLRDYAYRNGRYIDVYVAARVRDAF